MGIFGQWAQFKSERDFYRYARRHILPAFPTLPDRSQFIRLLRGQHDALVATSQLLLTLIGEWHSIYELLNSCAAPVRDSRRRGGSWLAGQADYGWSNRLGWYYGFHVLVSITPNGLITGFGFGSASTHDHKLLQTFLAARSIPQEQLPSVGRSEQHAYIGDKGFAGKRVHEQWKQEWGATVITASHPNYKRERQWSREERRWLAGLRQVVIQILEGSTRRYKLLTICESMMSLHNCKDALLGLVSQNRIGPNA